MRIRYTRRALRQIFDILTYIEARSPQGAANTQRRIQDLILLLKHQPSIGTPTQRAGFRRLVLAPYPYVILYQAKDTEVIIHSARHAARKRSGW